MNERTARQSDQRFRQRQDRQVSPSISGWSDAAEWMLREHARNVTADCGWGRLIFGHTFDDPAELAEAIRQERNGQRDIALYVVDPHVVLAQAPLDLFLDPSNTYRLRMTNYRPRRERPMGFRVRRLQTHQDAEGVNEIYAKRHMVRVETSFFWSHRARKTLTYYVAEDEATGRILGTVTGVDHVEAFEDPECGSSLWCLAVHPDAQHPGVGEALVRQLVEHYAARGRLFVDLSVMHDNEQAIALYEKLGFQRVPVFAIKRKNVINEPLFTGPAPEEGLNIYARILVDEARRRGIAVEVLDAEGGFFRLTHGGRSITCRESLSQLTDSIAMSRCDDKAVTRRLLERSDLCVPGQAVAGEPEANAAFLATHGSVVVKPARGEQGRGISVDIRDPADLEPAIQRARQQCETVLLEQFCEGQDLRIIVIGYKVVAGAVRKPAEVVGTGRHSIEKLIESQSRRRRAATGGESSIPLDGETERCVHQAGLQMTDILPEGQVLQVRKTANLHTGGTIHDVTDIMHPALVDAAVRAARAIEIPVVGLDLLVPKLDGPDYVIIEANERPGLANHEPQPTAQRFVDLLFPQTAG